MTQQMIARDALAGQMTPLDALMRIAGMERTCGVPSITDEMVERCRRSYNEAPGGTWDAIHATLEEFVRQTHPEEIRRATEQAARDAAMAAVVPSDRWNTGDRIVMPDGQEAVVTVFDDDAHTTVYAQTADDEAGRVAWGVGEPLNDAWSDEKQNGWWDALRRWGKQEDVG